MKHMNEYECLLKITSKMSSTYNHFREFGEDRKGVFTALAISVMAVSGTPVDKRYRAVRNLFLYDMEYLLDHKRLSDSDVAYIKNFMATLSANDGVFQVNQPEAVA